MLVWHFIWKRVLYGWQTEKFSGIELQEFQFCWSYCMSASFVNQILYGLILRVWKGREEKYYDISDKKKRKYCEKKFYCLKPLDDRHRDRNEFVKCDTNVWMCTLSTTPLAFEYIPQIFSSFLGFSRNFFHKLLLIFQ